jgi:two-component system sensor histidine kinase UhpB
MANIKNGFGLFSMQERVRSLNGEFTIERNLKKGMRISAVIPYPQLSTLINFV